MPLVWHGVLRHKPYRASSFAKENYNRKGINMMAVWNFLTSPLVATIGASLAICAQVLNAILSEWRLRNKIIWIVLVLIAMLPVLLVNIPKLK